MDYGLKLREKGKLNIHRVLAIKMNRNTVRRFCTFPSQQKQQMIQENMYLRVVINNLCVVPYTTNKVRVRQKEGRRYEIEKLVLHMVQ